MRNVILALVVVAGAFAAAMVYQQAGVEKTFGPAAMLGVSILVFLFLSLLITYLLYESRYRATVANLWLAAASVAISYLVLDLVAGWFLIRPLSPPLVPDSHRHHKLVPNSYAEFQQPDFSYVQRVNALGLRGQERQLQKPPNSYRILMLGDSFTMGKGVEDNQTFSVLLEQSLNRDVGACGGPSIEVLNAGVDSYAPVLSLIQLRNDLLLLKPDMVVLNLDVSDLVQEAAYRRVAVRGFDGEIVAVPNTIAKASAIERIRVWTERNLFFTRVLLFYTNRALGYKNFNVRDVVEEVNYETVAHTLAQDTVQRDEQWRDIFDSITRIKRHSERAGAEFLLTVYPWAHQISDTEWIPGRYAYMPKDAVASEKSLQTIKALSTVNGIQLVDLFPAFRAYQGAKSLYFRRDPHLTPAGHDVVAGGLEGYLEKKYLPTWCR